MGPANADGPGVAKQQELFDEPLRATVPDSPPRSGVLKLTVDLGQRRE